ncbi:DUF3800 domain-containing protein [Luteococcus sp. H138]|uniref:DUF3800 domain-containing protein n=1 Tax=unclassified Luteococcus TaxID=2639923 RepID=UPI00313B0157
MLIAYLDEFGHVGPYVSPQHKKYNDHPVFGYAGFVLPASNARQMGASFKRAKTELFKTEIAASKNPHQWERKGSEYFTTGSITKRPEQVRVFKALLKTLYELDGQLFYYGDEKLRGTLKQTGVDSSEITQRAMRETVNRLCTHADKRSRDLLILTDSITDKTRQEVVAGMYAHIFNRSKRELGRPEMLRVVEAPLHIESKLNSGIQFADWICALTARLAYWQLVPDSDFTWASEKFSDTLRGHFTYESKIHRPSGRDINTSELLDEGAARYKPGTLGDIAKIPSGFYDALRQGGTGGSQVADP